MNDFAESAARRVLIVGHGTCQNRGCEAILRSTIALLNRHLDSPSILIASLDAAYDRRLDFGDNVRVIPAVRSFSRWRYRLHRLLSPLYVPPPFQHQPMCEAIEWSDAVLSVGGDNFTIEYGFPQYFLDLNSWARERRKRLIIWAASIGPFPPNDAGRRVLADLALADVITCR